MNELEHHSGPKPGPEPERKTLKEVFDRAEYPLTGHCRREVDVLKAALAGVDGGLESDTYGAGKVIEDFEAKMAGVLGKEAAVFFPSGTMAQQIALRIWCDRRGVARVAYHPLCHLEIHEKDGLKELHRIEPILLADPNRLIGLADVMNLPDDIACLLLELPQREIGGQLPEFAELEAISAYCREQGIKLHLDGARLFEILPYYRKSAAEVCGLFDSVYISFYKGIGGVAGAILAGQPEFTQESKVWKRRHGGDLISLYPYILSADYYYEQRIGKMELYYEQARELAGMYNRCRGITTLPEIPVSNMFHVYAGLSSRRMEEVLIEICGETGVGLSHYVKERTAGGSYFEVSIGDRYDAVPGDKLWQAFELLDEKLKGETEI